METTKLASVLLMDMTLAQILTTILLSIISIVATIGIVMAKTIWRQRTQSQKEFYDSQKEYNDKMFERMETLQDNLSKQNITQTKLEGSIELLSVSVANLTGWMKRVQSGHEDLEDEVHKMKTDVAVLKMKERKNAS